jgi:hypothetical protein
VVVTRENATILAWVRVVDLDVAKRHGIDGNWGIGASATSKNDVTVNIF